MGEPENRRGCGVEVLGNRRVGWMEDAGQKARASGLRVVLRHRQVLALLCLH